MPELDNKLKAYYLVSIFSLIFAVSGFSYNTWRMEVTEDNSNVRTASFKTLIVLSELQQLIYSAHYDKDMVNGNPRVGWVKIGLITDLSSLISKTTSASATELNKLWAENWAKIENDEVVVNALIENIDTVRLAIKLTLKNLD